MKNEIKTIVNLLGLYAFLAIVVVVAWLIYIGNVEHHPAQVNPALAVAATMVPVQSKPPQRHREAKEHPVKPATVRPYPPEAAEEREGRALASFLGSSSEYKVKDIMLIPGNVGFRPVNGWVAMIDVWAQPDKEDAQEAAAEMVNLALSWPSKYRVARAQAFVYSREKPDANMFTMEATGNETPIILSDFISPIDNGETTQ